MIGNDDQMEHPVHTLCMTLSPDNVGVLKPLQLLQQRDLPEDGHGDAVLRQREVHRLEGHDLAGLRVARPVHGSVGSCKNDIVG